MSSGTLESNHPISSRIIEKVAVQEEVDSTELPRLYDIIDPEALDVIFSQGFGGRVDFPYCGYEIVVYGDGRVEVAESNH